METTRRWCQREEHSCWVSTHVVLVYRATQAEIDKGLARLILYLYLRFRIQYNTRVLITNYTTRHLAQLSSAPSVNKISNSSKYILTDAEDLGNDRAIIMYYHKIYLWQAVQYYAIGRDFHSHRGWQFAVR